MIKTIIADINNIIDAQTETSTDALVIKLDAEVKYYLHQAFLDAKIFDFTVEISKTSDGILLKASVQLSASSRYETMTWDLDVSRTSASDDAYKHAMSGI